MPKFKPGYPKPENSGRKKGTPNKPRPDQTLRAEVQHSVAAMAIRLMPELEKEFAQILEHNRSIDVVKQLLRLMTIATRFPGDKKQTDQQTDVIEPDETPAIPMPISKHVPTAREQMDELLFSNRLRGQAYVDEAIRLNRLVQEEEAQETARDQASRSSDDDTTPT